MGCIRTATTILWNSWYKHKHTVLLRSNLPAEVRKKHYLRDIIMMWYVVKFHCIINLNMPFHSSRRYFFYPLQRIIWDEPQPRCLMVFHDFILFAVRLSYICLEVASHPGNLQTEKIFCLFDQMLYLIRQNPLGYSLPCYCLVLFTVALIQLCF